MSKELVIQNDFSIQLAELDKIQDTCKKLLQTKHYANLGELGVHAILARAKALGIHPFEALNGGFYVVQGKVGMSTEMMAALVRQRGHSITKDPKSHSECMILHGKRADNGDVWTCTFSKDDALAAGLWNTATWKKYPAVMLYNRCMSMLFRQLFPDLSLGAGYEPNEIHEITKTGDYQASLPVAECQVEPVINNKVEKINILVTNEQAAELEKIVSECTEEYQDNIKNFMLKNKMPSYAFIPLETFEKIIIKARVIRDEHKQALENEYLAQKEMEKQAEVENASN